MKLKNVQVRKTFHIYMKSSCNLEAMDEMKQRRLKLHGILIFDHIT